MELFDKNRSWEPPEGYSVQAVTPVGAFIQIKFSKRVEDTDARFTDSTVIVTLNDQGREVLRTEEKRMCPKHLPLIPPPGWTTYPDGSMEPPQPVVQLSRWQKFWNLVSLIFVWIMGR